MPVAYRIEAFGPSSSSFFSPFSPRSILHARRKQPALEESTSQTRRDMHQVSRIGFALLIVAAALVRGAGLEMGNQAGATKVAAPKQLFAVRGEIKKAASADKGMLAITIKPFKDFAEVTVAARENDLVGSAVKREGGHDLFNALIGEDSRDDDGLTAAELREGDLVSIIYDPNQQNRALEIYVH